MCYINGIKVSLATYLEYKKIQKELKHINAIVKNKEVQKGFDYDDWPVLKTSPCGSDWDVVPMQWGFLPPNLKTPEAVERFRKGYKNSAGVFVPPFTTLNAMGEELLLPDKMFRHAALHNRCLVLSTGFYEHTHVFQKNKRTGAPRKTATKFPYHITVPSTNILLLAGIYSSWRNMDTGETKETFAIVTTRANSIMEKVHNSKKRMPVILSGEMAERWTDPHLTEAEIASIASYQLPSALMAAYPVRKTLLEEQEPSELFIEPGVPELITYNYGSAV